MGTATHFGVFKTGHPSGNQMKNRTSRFYNRDAQSKASVRRLKQIAKGQIPFEQRRILEPEPHD